MEVFADRMWHLLQEAPLVAGMLALDPALLNRNPVGWAERIWSYSGVVAGDFACNPTFTR